MDKLVIFGTSMFSSVVYKTIAEEQLAEVLCFTLNRSFIGDRSFEGLEVIPFEDLNSRFDMASVKLVLAIGYGKMNENRKMIYELCKAEKYKIYTLISKKAIIYTDEIGEGSIILPTAFIGPYVKLGRCCIVWNMTCFSHHSVVGDFCHFAGGTMVGGGTDIGNMCFVGMNCTFKNGIIVSDKTFVAANSYISADTEINRGYTGIPARMISNVTSDVLIRFVK